MFSLLEALKVLGKCRKDFFWFSKYAQFAFKFVTVIARPKSHVISERDVEHCVPQCNINYGCLTGRRLMQRRGRGGANFFLLYAYSLGKDFLVPIPQLPNPRWQPNKTIFTCASKIRLQCRLSCVNGPTK